MNWKSSTITTLVLLVFVIFGGVVLADSHSAVPFSLPAVGNIFVSGDGHFATINGKNYAMNPTVLPAAVGETPDFTYAMNPTMLPFEVGEALDLSFSMNPTMFPIAVEEVPDFSQSMNPTMLPEQVLNGE